MSLIQLQHFKASSLIKLRPITSMVKKILIVRYFSSTNIFFLNKGYFCSLATSKLRFSRSLTDYSISFKKTNVHQTLSSPGV